jgi:accessory gene regulator protein AgrB
MEGDDNNGHSFYMLVLIPYIVSESNNYFFGVLCYNNDHCAIHILVFNYSSNSLDATSVYGKYYHGNGQKSPNTQLLIFLFGKYQEF